MTCAESKLNVCVWLLGRKEHLNKQVPNSNHNAIFTAPSERNKKKGEMNRCLFAFCDKSLETAQNNNNITFEVRIRFAVASISTLILPIAHFATKKESVFFRGG